MGEHWSFAISERRNGGVNAAEARRPADDRDEQNSDGDHRAREPESHSYLHSRGTVTSVGLHCVRRLCPLAKLKNRCYVAPLVSSTLHSAPGNARKGFGSTYEMGSIWHFWAATQVPPANK
jgi:hypothetical protein